MLTSDLAPAIQRLSNTASTTSCTNSSATMRQGPKTESSGRLSERHLRLIEQCLRRFIIAKQPSPEHREYSEAATPYVCANMSHHIAASNFIGIKKLYEGAEMDVPTA